VPESLSPHGESAVLLAIDGVVKATVILADQIKVQSKATISDLQNFGVNKLVMLSGDKPEVVLATAKEIGLEDARGALLPDDKMRAVEELMERDRVAFVGDGLNDAPVMTMSHVGIAMGGIASDATIEAADIVIQGNDPYKVVEGVEISRHTHKIVVQNIIFALGFKFAVMILALMGFASLTLAVLADVGVTLLAVLNSLRALNFKAKSFNY
uniref:HAD-IC family P-type ATPase n=1 Tax=uncultured Porphyromonas sp. TaxID=159274 RepID=UPI00261AC2F5